jgi:predicted Rossmann fold flavoprotein
VTTTFDVVVLGGGAAGLQCVITAGLRGRRVLVLDHANKVGKKILMSGGGRCNFTNTGVTAANYLSANPHFCKSALARYTPSDFVARVEAHGIGYHEKELGQLFCNDSSKQILRMLLDECAEAGVRIETECRIEEVLKTADGFSLRTTRGDFAAGSLVIATGGLSIPKMGATGYGYQLARHFGHRVLPTRAGLVPLTLSGKPLDDWADLAGVALPAAAAANDRQFTSAILITHRGLSGPAILQISSYWQPGDALHLDFFAGSDAADWLAAQQAARPTTELRTALADVLPKRLAQRLVELGIDSKPLRQYRPAELRAIAAQLQAWPIVASGTEGYRTAEVTLGGVDTDGLSSSTMQSKSVPGLYFVGEVVDVTGWLGGYNFQWAWASGVAAGNAV